MKKLAVVFAVLGLSSFGFAQQNAIELVNFEKEIRKNTTEVKDTKFIEAKTSCAGEANISYDDKRFSGGCAGVLQRTYTITDECGNTKEVLQFITLEDTTPPVFQNKPTDITVESRLELKQPETVVAFDETGTNVTITVDESYDMDGKDFVKVIRTWTATDICDNQATHSRVITIPRRSRPDNK